MVEEGEWRGRLLREGCGRSVVVEEEDEAVVPTRVVAAVAEEEGARWVEDVVELGGEVREGGFMAVEGREDCLEELNVEVEELIDGVICGSGESGMVAVAAATACSHLTSCGRTLSGEEPIACGEY